MSGSSPEPEAVTRSAGIALSGVAPYFAQMAEARSARAGLVGLRFDPAAAMPL